MKKQAMRMATIAAIALTLLFSGCAGIEQTFRDANGVVDQVIDLSAEAQMVVYAIEDRVESACRPLFKSANQRMVGGEVSMFTKVSVLVTSERCRHTVDQAKRDLDLYRQNQDAENKVANSNKPKAF